MNFLHLVFVACISFREISGVVSGQSSQVVEIDGQANITGSRTVDDVGTLFSFEGIPYAKPPVKEFRWQPPILIQATELNGFEALHPGPKCLQPSRSSGETEFTQDEDCLYLNIYTRSLPKLHGIALTRSAKPVIVYIHPGGFMYGSGYNMGPELFLRNNDAIIVTINYRLGVLGFLSTNDVNLPGNYGLLDQITALEWVNLYIRFWGGDPTRITLMGHSAGAAAVHILTLSPRAKDLFNAAIIQSGSALCDWAIAKDPAKYAVDIGRVLNCTDLDDSFNLVTCLKNKSGSELIESQQKQIDFWVLPQRLGPVVDVGIREEPVLPELPSALIDSGNFSSKVPLIVGVTREEGLMGYAYLHVNDTEKFRDDEYFHTDLIPKVVRALFPYKNEKELETITKAVDEYYFHGLNVSTFNGQQLAIMEMTNFFGDTMFYSCHWNMLEKYAAFPEMKVYNYVFSYKRSKSPKILRSVLKELQRKGVHHSLFDYGVPHGEDMFYFFRPMRHASGNHFEVYSEHDLEIADYVTKLWVSFAKDRAPQVLNGWRPIARAPTSYYEISSGSKNEVGNDFRKGEALFWLRTIPLLEAAENEIEELEYLPYQLLFWIFLAISTVLLILIVILCCYLSRRSRQRKANF